MPAFKTLGQIEQELLAGKPRQRFVIPAVLPVGPCLLYGASGSGKTGATIRSAVSIASGLRWADRDVAHGAVLYVAGEDYHGAQERMVAAARDLGRVPADVPMAIVEPKETGFTTSDCRLEIELAAQGLAKQFGLPVSLVVIDTLAACFGLKSQDDATAASEYMGQADKLARKLSCAVLSIHHTGKNENGGMRGSRVFFDRADAVLRVNRGKATSSFLEVEKLRKGPNGARFAFDICGADLPTADGPISIQVVRNFNSLEPAERQDPEEAKAKRDTTDAGVALFLLHGLLIEGVASKAEWQEACFTHWSSKPSNNARSRAFSTTLRKLQATGDIAINGDTVSVSVSRNAAHSSAHPFPPDTVSVSVSTTPSKGGAHSHTNRPNDGLSRSDCTDSAGSSEGSGEEMPKANAFGRGAGGKTPAEDGGAAAHAHSGTGG